jgi:hypothetical protein
MINTLIKMKNSKDILDYVIIKWIIYKVFWFIQIVEKKEYYETRWGAAIRYDKSDIMMF